jgi:hypothetical protein
MRTDQLIQAIAADGPIPGRSLAARMALALLLGGAAAAVLFGLMLGVRGDLAQVALTWRFALKVIIATAAFIAALWAIARLSRPEARMRDVAAVLSAPLLLLAGCVVLELLTVRPDHWMTGAIGSNSRICLVSIPLLAAAPLAALLTAVRVGAPVSPAAAGAVAGLAAGALGAALYATHCIDDSPLFVALWYTPAIALVILAGALAGRLVLRW